VAIDVPSRASKAPPGSDETIDSPGARSERNGALFEKYESTSDFEVEPTLIADEMHAGDDRFDVDPLLPDATTVATPIDRRLSMMGLYG
jgi:hypothetical protein